MEDEARFFPEVGRVARDTRMQRLGLVLGIDGQRVRLCGLANGHVWEAALATVRRLTPREERTARLAAAHRAARLPG